MEAHTAQGVTQTPAIREPKGRTPIAAIIGVAALVGAVAGTVWFFSRSPETAKASAAAATDETDPFFVVNSVTTGEQMTLLQFGAPLADGGEIRTVDLAACYCIALKDIAD